MWAKRLVPATTGARFVVSDRGDILSPKYAPATIAPAVIGSEAPSPPATLTRATPTVPTEPHDVPVSVETTAVIRNDTGMIQCGSIARSPRSTIIGMVPLIIQVPVSIPMDIRISRAGIVESILRQMAASICSQLTPSRRAKAPAKVPATISRMTGAMSSQTVPVTRRAIITTTGVRAWRKVGLRRDAAASAGAVSGMSRSFRVVSGMVFGGGFRGRFPGGGFPGGRGDFRSGFRMVFGVRAGRGRPPGVPACREFLWGQ